MPKAVCGGRLFHLTLWNNGLSLRKVRAGSWSRSPRGVLLTDLLHGLLSLPYSIRTSSQGMARPTANWAPQHQSSVKKMLHILACRPVLWGQVFSSSSLFPSNSSLCQDNIKLASINGLHLRNVVNLVSHDYV